MARGGYQQPRNPAPVSGPGSLSRRTDGRGQPKLKLSEPEYGEQTEFQNIQGGAPMAQSAGLPPVTRLDAPTERPDEPVTAGSPSGPGAGTEALGAPKDILGEDFQMLRTYLPLMQMYADSDASTGTMRTFVRYLKGVSGA